MADEYCLRFFASDNAGLESLLSSMPHFHRMCELEGRKCFEYRSMSNQGDMPDSMVTIETYGLYYCDYGNSELMNRIVDEITNVFGEVIIENLE